MKKSTEKIEDGESVICYLPSPFAIAILKAKMVVTLTSIKETWKV
jgi:hypothetical protein